jgi:hypothetical protein
MDNQIHPFNMVHKSLRSIPTFSKITNASDAIYYKNCIKYYSSHLELCSLHFSKPQTTNSFEKLRVSTDLQE